MQLQPEKYNLGRNCKYFWRAEANSGRTEIKMGDKNNYAAHSKQNSENFNNFVENAAK